MLQHKQTPSHDYNRSFRSDGLIKLEVHEQKLHFDIIIQTSFPGPCSVCVFFCLFLLAKECSELTTKSMEQTVLVPCFSSLGSTCRFGCRPGFFMQGDGRANCSLNSTNDGVSWSTGQFSCEGELSTFFLKLGIKRVDKGRTTSVKRKRISSESLCLRANARMVIFVIFLRW